MAKASAEIGIKYTLQDADSLKSKISALTKMFEAEAKKIEAAYARAYGKINATPKGGTGNSGGIGGTGKGKSPFQAMEQDAKRVYAALANEEKKYAALKAKYTSTNAREDKKLTAELIANLKRLQDEKVRVNNAMQNSTDASIKHELAARKKALSQEIAMSRQVALDKGGVTKGGMGASTGLLGTFRQVAPGGGMLGAVGGGPMAIAAGLTAIIQIGAKFQTAMADLSAITGVTGKDLDSLGERAKNLGPTFGVTGTEAVGAMKLVLSELGPQLAKDGVSMELFTKNVLTLSQASSVDADTATKALTVTMSQFGLTSGTTAEQAAESSRVMNILAAGAKVGSAEVGDLAESMKNVGVTAKASGLSVEQTAASIEVLGVNGIKGGEAGTGLRNVLGLMSSGSKRASEQLKKVGLTFSDINPKAVGLENGLSKLKAGYDKLKTPTEKSAFLTKLFGRENAQAGQIMMNNVSKLKEFTGAMTGTNVATEQAKIKQVTFEETIKRIGAQLQNVAINIFDALAPILSMLGDVLSPVIEIVKFLVDANLAWIEGLVNAGIAIVQFLGEATGITDWITNDVVPWFEKMIPIVKQAFDIFLEQAKAVGVTLISYLKPILSTIIDVVTWLWKNVFTPLANFIKGTLVVYIGLLISVFSWLYSNVLKPIGVFLGGAFSKVWVLIVQQWNNAKKTIDWLSTAVKNAWTWLVKAGDAVVSWIRNIPLLSSAFQGVVSALSWVIEKLEGAYNVGKNLLSLGGILGGGDEEGSKPSGKSIGNLINPGRQSGKDIGDLMRPGPSSNASNEPDISSEDDAGDDEEEKKAKAKEERKARAEASRQARAEKAAAKSAEQAKADALARDKKIADDKAASDNYLANEAFFKGEITRKALDRKLLEIEVQHAKDLLSVAIKHNDNVADAKATNLAAMQKLKDQDYEEEKAELNRHHKIIKEQIDKDYLDGTIDKAQKRLRTLQETVSFNGKMIELNDRYNQDMLEAAKLSEEEMLSLKMAELAEIEKEQEKDLKKMAARQKKERGKLGKDDRAEQEIKDNLALLKIERDFIEARLKLAKEYGILTEQMQTDSREKLLDINNQEDALKDDLSQAQLERNTNYLGVLALIKPEQEKMFGDIDKSWKNWSARLGLGGKFLTPMYEGLLSGFTKFTDKWLSNVSAWASSYLDIVTDTVGKGLEIAANFVVENATIVGKWILQNLELAGSFMVNAVASLISWQMSFGWWNLAIIPAEIALLYGMYEGAKTLFAPKEHAEGGIVDRPLYTRGGDGQLHVAGEKGPEVIAPLGGLLGMIKKVVESAGASNKLDNSFTGLQKYLSNSYARNDAPNSSAYLSNRFNGVQSIGDQLTLALNKVEYVTVLDQSKNILSIAKQETLNARRRG